MGKRPIYRQILVTTIANISSIGAGVAMGWSSPNITKLQDELLADTPLDRILTESEIGWIGSLVPIGGAISSFLGGTMASKFGRKPILLFSTICLLVAYVILALGKTIELIYAARLLHGFSIGLTMIIMPIYIGEISQDALRGPLGSILTIALNAGILFDYCVAPFITYEMFQFICAIFPSVFLVLSVFIPESPAYLLIKGNNEKAIKSLMFLRNSTSKLVEPELGVLQQLVDQSKHQKSTIKRLFCTQGNRRALIICCGLMWAQQFSGIQVVTFYSESIFERAGGNLSPTISSIISLSVPAIICCIVPYTIERFGRKPSLLVSAIGMGLATSTMSTYLFLEHLNSALSDSLSFVPIIAIMLYSVFFTIGYGPVPVAILGEILGADIKTHVITISSIVGLMAAAIILLFFETLNEAIGPHWVFAIFTVNIIIGGVFVKLFLFETKGLTLVQIQRILNKE